jgi:hypothetical protein
MGRTVKAKLQVLDNGHQYVSTKYTDDGTSGTHAEIWLDEDGVWLWIQSDPYEGSVMLHAKALPQLIRALKRLTKPV